MKSHVLFLRLPDASLCSQYTSTGTLHLKRLGSEALRLLQRWGQVKILTLMGEMLRKEHDLGLASLCIGGGQGMATIIKKV